MVSRWRIHSGKFLAILTRFEGKDCFWYRGLRVDILVQGALGTVSIQVTDLRIFSRGVGGEEVGL
jgi:hypothetical protein